MVVLLLLSWGVFRLTLAERRAGVRRIDTVPRISGEVQKNPGHFVVTEGQPFPAVTLHIRGGAS
jgi:hypothetical protein